jgi:hypothetical protein
MVYDKQFKKKVFHLQGFLKEEVKQEKIGNLAVKKTTGNELISSAQGFNLTLQSSRSKKLLVVVPYHTYDENLQIAFGH